MRRSRGYDPLHHSSENSALLVQILDTAREGGLAVFDLDGCLFDNRPRQVQIIREYASLYHCWELYKVEIHDFEDWSFPRTLKKAGVPDDVISLHYPALRQYWESCFFTSAYVRYDHAMPGAAELVRRVYEAGMKVIYLTGRDHQMREGTEQSLRRFGFPYDEPGVRLLTKPRADMEDTAFKEEAMETLAAYGQVRIYLDNEPSNVNLYKKYHADALVVFVETDHSPRPVEPLSSIPWLRSFLARPI